MAQGASVPVQRALAFQYILENKFICINEGELIVGERGHAGHNLSEILAAPAKGFGDSAQSRESFLPVRCHRKRAKLTKRLSSLIGQAKPTATVFLPICRTNGLPHTKQEFLPSSKNSVRGHAVAGDKIYRKGMVNIIDDIHEAISQLEILSTTRWHTTSVKVEKRMEISARAIIRWAERHAEKLEALAATENNAVRRDELQQMAIVCRGLNPAKPETFHEALQYYWFVHGGGYRTQPGIRLIPVAWTSTCCPSGKEDGQRNAD